MRTMARRTSPRAVTRAALVLAVALGATACTKDDPDPSTSSKGSTTSSTSGGSPSAASEDAAAKILSFAESDPIARTTGAIPARDGAKGDATAEIVSLVAGPSSTVLLVKLSAPQEITPDVSFLEYDNYGKSVDGISLRAGSIVLYPSTYRYGPSPLAQQCLCSQQVTKLGPDGVYVSADFGALPPGTSTATLAIPGLQPVDVKVTAAG